MRPFFPKNRIILSPIPWADKPWTKETWRHGGEREAEDAGGQGPGGNAADGAAGAARARAGALCRMRHAPVAGGGARRGGDLRGLRALWAGNGGLLRLRAGRLLRPAGRLPGVLILPGLCGGTAVCGRGHPDFFRILRLLRYPPLPAGLVHARGGRPDGRGHRLRLPVRPGVDGGQPDLFRHGSALMRRFGLFLPHRLLPLDRQAGGGGTHPAPECEPAHPGGYPAHHPVQDHPLRRHLGGPLRRGSGGDGHRLQGRDRTGRHRGRGRGHRYGPVRRGNAVLFHGIRPLRRDGGGVPPAGQAGRRAGLCALQRPGGAVDLERGAQYSRAL